MFLVVVVWLWPSAALARTRVVILEPEQAEGPVSEAVTRTRAELEAEGFEVVMRPYPAPADPPLDTRRVLEAAARDNEAEAAIAVQSVGEQADVWVVDRITGKTLVRSVDVRDQPADEQPRALAIRAVELLKASLVEAVAPATRKKVPRPLPPDVELWLEPHPGPLVGVGVQLGVGLLSGFDGIGPSGGPLLRVSYGLDIGLAFRFGFCGPAFGKELEGPVGSAAVREEVGSLELVYAPWVDWAGFTPIVWAGAGFHHLHARGEVQPGLLAANDDAWGGMATAGIGLGYRITDRVMLALDGAAIVTFPRLGVTMAGQSIATTGRPSVLSSFSVVARF